MHCRGKKLIVVKIGTSSLTNTLGELQREKIQSLIEKIHKVKKEGHSVVIVTSGSIAAGFRRLGYNQRPKTIPAKQAAASVGQGLLMEEYTKQLWKYNYIAAQILLTRGDFSDKRRYKNAANSLEILLKKGAIPIINENDTTSIEELKFGDNDTLSANVAGMIHADLLVILTDIDGVYTSDPRKNPSAERIEKIEVITPELEALAGSEGTSVGTGGMRSKISAAKIAVMAGVPVVISSAEKEDILYKCLQGEAEGTYFTACKRNLNTNLQWMAFYSKCKGKLYVDEGAAEALENKGKSLLPSGIVKIQGDFNAGDVVEVFIRKNGSLTEASTNKKKAYLGKGIVNYSSEELQRLKGCSSEDIYQIAGITKTEAIHRDNWLGNIKVEKRRMLNE
ncbi:glutamate 5-kinase [Clostridium polynesiense]|uniref:glutamate 5-kinase n=1 Tax=Clostridium polynesiense TaxID=1325933 RepID=UPI00058CEED7|nr:glutamate 5-kinase [Clostridium polynesiense]